MYVFIFSLIPFPILNSSGHRDPRSCARAGKEGGRGGRGDLIDLYQRWRLGVDNGKSKSYRLSLSNAQWRRGGSLPCDAVCVCTYMYACAQVVARDRWKGKREGGICTAAEKSYIPVRLFAKRSQRSVHGTVTYKVYLKSFSHCYLL